MSEFNPASIESATSLANSPGQAQEQRREEALRPSNKESTEPLGGPESSTLGQGRTAAEGDLVQVTANPPQAANKQQDMSASEASRIAQETRGWIQDSPREAAEAVKGTAHEPASTRISRAIDALN